jgi:hypothetical protein
VNDSPASSTVPTRSAHPRARLDALGTGARTGVSS